MCGGGEIDVGKGTGGSRPSKNCRCSEQKQRMTVTALGVTSEWLAQGRDHWQRGAGKVAAVWGFFHVNKII